MSSIETRKSYPIPNPWSMLGDALIIGLSRNTKCGLAICADTLLLLFAMWAAFALRYSEWWPMQMAGVWWLVVVAPLMALPVLYGMGLYRTVLRYMSNKAFYIIVQAMTMHVVLMVIGIAVLIGFEGIPRSAFVIYWLIATVLIVASRIFIRNLFQWAEGLKHIRTPVIIYGAGQAGAELVRSLREEKEFFPVAFIDDKSLLHGIEVAGLKVYSSESLGALIKRYGVKQILLAIPAAPRARRREVLQFLEQLSVQVKTVPSLTDLLAGKYALQDVQEVDLEDLLGREPI
ncbi:MAG: polysaccharide biosynthesis protein, partial [Candidatus Binatia bacterium]